MGKRVQNICEKKPYLPCHSYKIRSRLKKVSIVTFFSIFFVKLLFDCLIYIVITGLILRVKHLRYIVLALNLFFLLAILLQFLNLLNICTQCVNASFCGLRAAGFTLTRLSRDQRVSASISQSYYFIRMPDAHQPVFAFLYLTCCTCSLWRTGGDTIFLMQMGGKRILNSFIPNALTLTRIILFRRSRRYYFLTTYIYLIYHYNHSVHNTSCFKRT